MPFSPAILVWVVIFALRAFRGRQEPADRPSSATLDGWTGVVLIGQAIAFFTLIATFGPSPFLAYGFLILGGPSFLVWRVCQPLGLRRSGRVLLLLILGGPAARSGRFRLFEASLPPRPAHEDDSPDLPLTLGRRSKESRLVEASPWTCCALALQADGAGRPEDASRLARGVLELPGDLKLPGTVARVGVELLAVAALRRRDWPEVFRRASAGRGRACRFLRLLARTHLVGDVPARWLWLAWGLAPRRLLTFGDVRVAATRKPRPVATRGRARPERRYGAWRLHLRLLQRVAGGGRVHRRVVLRLARVWDNALGAEARAHLKARALELGVLDVDGAGRAVCDGVLDDLESLAARAHGRWPTSVDSELGEIVMERAEDRLYQDLEPFVAPYRRGTPEIGYPLDEWDRWMEFRHALERLVDANGDDAISTAWYQGVRGAAWNWPCKLLDAHQGRAAWACLAMFHWAVELAERAGDAEGVRVNRENVKVAARLVNT